MIGRSLALCCNKRVFGAGKNSNSVQVELHVNCWKQISKKFKEKLFSLLRSIVLCLISRRAVKAAETMEKGQL